MLDTRSGEILSAIEGVEYLKIAPNLATFFEIFMTWIQVYQSFEDILPDANSEDYDDELYYKIKHEKIIPKFLNTIKNLLTTNEIENLNEFWFG